MCTRHFLRIGPVATPAMHGQASLRLHASDAMEGATSLSRSSVNARIMNMVEGSEPLDTAIESYRVVGRKASL